MSVTDFSVMVVDEFVPTETSYIVIRYNRNATPIKIRERQPEATTRAHVVCALLRERSQKKKTSIFKESKIYYFTKRT